MTTANTTLFNPTQLVLELSQAQIDRAWQQSQTAGNASSRWQQYLNQVALDVFLPWLQSEEDASAKLGLNKTDCVDLWQLVNGTSIEIKGAKLVLIPSEAEDLSEIRVPQEWVDIPELTADYYLAVQVSVDGGFVRVWGYTTQRKLKTQANFDYNDRTYNLSEAELITDLDVLWLARELCPEEVTQTEVEPIGVIETNRAENLVERLSSQSQLLPRLAIPFDAWASLIANPTWRAHLAAKRRGATIKTPVMQWLKQGIDAIASELAWRQFEVISEAVGAKGVASEALASNTVPQLGLAKRITISQQPYELRVIPLGETSSWRVELSCVTPGCAILPGMKLRLLTEDLQAFEGNEDVAIEPVTSLFIEVDLEPEESLFWQVEPTPDNYQLELLQF